ncbi:MAG: hypothetical protein JXA20_07145 [Spirochaetes bacterium]|nr:hypothetical protein [Spirochaetota bacterium]
MRFSIYSLLFLLAIGFTSCAIGTDEALDNLFTSDSGLFVAGSDGGNVVVSRDGKAWILLSTTGRDIVSITYVNGRFFYVSDNPVGYQTSLDLVNWGTFSSTVGYIPRDTIGIDAFSFYVVGISGGNPFVYKTDGSGGYTVMYNPATGQFNSIAYGNHVFVAIGNDPANSPSYSFDGATWYAATPISGCFFQKVIFANDHFIAAGYNGSNYPVIIMSFDGINWTQNLNPMATPVNLYGIAYGRGRYVAVGAGGTNSFVCYSENGTAWINEQIDSTGIWLTAVTYGNGRFIAVGPSGRILYSEDGLIWAVVPSSASWGKFNDVIFVPNID